jgi:hypothetical protein
MNQSINRLRVATVNSLIESNKQTNKQTYWLGYAWIFPYKPSLSYLPPATASQTLWCCLPCLSTKRNPKSLLVPGLTVSQSACVLQNQIVYLTTFKSGFHFSFRPSSGSPVPQCIFMCWEYASAVLQPVAVLQCLLLQCLLLWCLHLLCLHLWYLYTYNTYLSR